MKLDFTSRPQICALGGPLPLSHDNFLPTRHKSDTKPYMYFEGEWDKVLCTKEPDNVSFRADPNPACILCSPVYIMCNQ